MWILKSASFLDYDAHMYIKFSSNSPLFQQTVELLKLEFRTTANAKAVRMAIENYWEISRKAEIQEAQVESMQSEINRLRELLEINKSSSISAKIRHLRSFRQ